MKLSNLFRCVVVKQLSHDHALNIVRLEPLPDQGEVNTRLLVESPIGNAEVGHLLLPNGIGFEVGKVYEIEVREVVAPSV